MSSSVIPPSTMQLTYWAMIDRLDSVTPFGRDSVPLVYMSWIGSSSPITTPGSDRSGCSSHSVTSSQPAGAGTGTGTRWLAEPGPAASVVAAGATSASARITPRTAICPRSAVASADSATSTRRSSATMPLTPAWPRMKATSSARSMKLIGTEMAPRRARAR